MAKLHRDFYWIAIRLLARVSTLPAKRFDLVGAVRDGRQAVEAARRLDPDLILLDITMPELNGFQSPEN